MQPANPEPKQSQITYDILKGNYIQGAKMVYRRFIATL